MKIAVSGTQNIGKSTFVDDFKKNWKSYKKPKKTYRDFIKNEDLDLNREGTEESQEIILNALIDEAQNAKGKHVIFDRCPLDNLVYTMWLNAKGYASDEFVKKTIDLVRESLVFFDIIFFLPITKHSPVAVEAKENRETDLEYREEIDVLFKSLMSAYHQESHIYFPFANKLGSPAIIEIFGTPEERVQLAKFYINEKGDPFGEEDSLIKEELTDDALNLARESMGLL